MTTEDESWEALEAYQRRAGAENICKREYESWLSLLKSHGHADMLTDPYNVWLEAWSVCSILKDNGKPH